jgi:hypothetical protein
MCSGVGDWTCLQPGFPIRKSSNHSSVASSSRLIAGSYVLHRLLVPRHPPCALNNLTTKIWMLASTVQFSSYGRDSAPFAGACSHRGASGSSSGSARNRPEPVRVEHAPVPSGPNSVPRPPPRLLPFRTGRRPDVLGREMRGERPTDRCSTHEQPPRDVRSGSGAWTPADRRQMLLRKEVIQPHLPVRLPCYDFVPIASPTFDGSLHKGWATGFGCYRLS